jgi:predicted lipoprotein with Yx(FWY)xxD motif
MRTSNIRFVAVAALAAIAFAACSSSSKPASSTTSSTNVTTTTAAPASSGTPTSATTGGAKTVSTATTSLGKILVDGKGLTVYTYGGDTSGKSACTGGCASIWPPVAVTGTPTYGAGLTASKFSTITRDDGTKQLAVNGMPLYTFAGKTAGDTSGNNVNKFVVVMASAA